jgi:hypothetical protein
MRAREDYSWSECAEMVKCVGVWHSLAEWGDSLNLSSDDVEWINPHLDSIGRVWVSLPMYDSLVDFGMEETNE